MMRWLKEKKREKKSTSSWEGEDGKEDDYGFDKEKQASKSPSTRRQLPPTPATPEEKSPHIYEEIPDLPFSCSTEVEKALLQSKFNKRRNGATPNTYSQPKKNVTNDDINPYMVVPVDKEVCQTPTHFHRNGTPEVHCDVIVKETHCEILLTRKPKVGNFRLGSAALTGDPEGSLQPGSRNNTHYCSRDRRASVDVHTSGKQSTRMNCLGAPSTQSMPNFSDLAANVIEENNNGDSAGSGIVTYTSASNFIPRSTNLTFHPLGGKDPKKEAFGSDCSDDSNSGAFTSRRDENLSADTNGVSYASVQDICSASKCVTYASLLEQTQSGHGGCNVPNLPQDKSITDASLYRFSDHLSTISKLQPGSSASSGNDLCGVRAGIIQSPSPSNASCTYASVTFPAEPKLYNTIPDLIPSDFTDAGHSQLESEAISGVIYSRVSETFGTEANFQIKGDHCDKKSAKNPVYPAMTSYTRSESSITRTSLGATSNSAVCRNRAGSEFKSSIYSGVVAPENNQNPYNSIESDTLRRRSSLFPSSTGACRRSLDLDFCSCSDEHSSSCGCTEAKMDEDLTSLAGAVGEGQNNCKGCGRLIRQITYSESYSDETYEHVYSSRLLIRNGRRFSSPDITCLEASNPEPRFLHHSRSPEFNVSRDDTWASSRSDDLIPPAYGACDDNGFVSNYSEITSLKRRDSDLSEYRLSPRMYQGSLVNSRVFLRQNTSPVSSETSMFCGMRAAVSTSSVFSTGPAVVSDLHFKSKTQHKDAKFLKSGPTSAANTTSKNTTKDNLHSGTTKSKHSIPDTVENKPNTFSGIFSKFSRTKPPKPTKSLRTESVELLETKPVNQSNANEPNVQISENRQKDFEIPEKNVKKLSKFFQRLSSKDTVKPLVENTIDFLSSESMNMTRQSSATETNQGSKLDLPKKPSITDFQCITGQCHNQNMVPDVYQSRNFTEDSTNPKTSPAVGSEAWSVLTVSADIHPDPGNDAGPDAVAGSKPQTNTDSGDTCYEYDISTSSEGEQANYDYFLSKVKKTLNLEHEVQHIAAANIARRRHLCKKCKKDDSAMNDCLTSSSSDGEENVCPHLAAKIGDLRDIIHDLVVDQRAAILDCLTDFAHSPYNLKNNGPEAHCRKCGCELMTSDSESLTTVYSLLSQQLSVASPSGQTQSCESDEGTMADNSCESADEGCVENGDIPLDAGTDYTSHVCPDTGFTKSERGSHKNKKREKKEKKTVQLNAYSGSEKEQTRAHKTATGPRGISPTHPSSPHKDRHPGSSECKANSSKDGGRNTFALNTRRNTPKKSSFFPAYSDTQPSTPHALLGSTLADDRIDHLKMCAVSRSKPGALSDKALQDIYAPLPSKALSLLTSRNYGTHTGVSCTCGRERDPSSAITASHIKTGEPSLPPAGVIKEGQSLNSSPSCPSLLQEHNSDRVFPVQAHLDTRAEKRELSAVKGRKEAEIRKVELGKSSVGDGNELGSETSRAKTMNPVAPPHPSGTNDGVFTAKIYEIVSPYPEKSSIGGAGLENINSNTRRGFSTEFTTSWVAFNSNRVAVAHSVGEYDYTSHKHSENARAIPSIKNQDRDSTKPDSAEVAKTKFKLTRKHRLELASLDLLPETALRGDDEGVAVEEKRQPTVRTKRSKVVERMAKIFESRPLNEGSASNTSHKFGETGKTAAVKNRSEKSKYSENVDRGVTYESMRNIVEDSSVRSNEVVTARVAGKLTPDQAEMLANHTNVYTANESSPKLARGGAPSGRSSVKSRDLDAALTSPDASDLLLATSKSQTSAGRSKGDKEKVVKPRRSHSEDKLKASDCKLLHELKGSKSKSFVSGRVSTETNKIASPTPSLSSSSSSSLTKKKTSSHARHKKVSRKTYKKRSKSRSERSRSCGREERTFYYLSSDLSDIDVVEVADWETYATKLAPSPKSIHDPKQKFPKGDDVGASDSTSTSGVLMNDARYDQEVYSIPPSSSDLRQARDKGEATSPQASPELPKPRKNKRTDVYKTRRSNNKLLSDLIIRNYDMQIYGNI